MKKPKKDPQKDVSNFADDLTKETQDVLKNILADTLCPKGGNHEWKRTAQGPVCIHCKNPWKKTKEV